MYLIGIVLREQQEMRKGRYHFGMGADMIRTVQRGAVIYDRDHGCSPIFIVKVDRLFVGNFVAVAFEITNRYGHENLFE